MTRAPDFLRVLTAAALGASFLLLGTGAASPAAEPPGSEASATLARQILDRSGVRGGAVVHLGSGEGTLTAALRAGEGFVVQGLESDPAKVERSREYVRSLGLYGPVSIDQWDGRRLPYAQNLVNLIVAEDRGAVSREEMLRVLAPRGVALLRDGERWTKLVKPWPGEIDEWSHYLHGADNNAVAADEVVGPPQHVQWMSDPPFARSHEINSSLAAMVSAGGRLFYIWDEGPIGLTDPRFPSQWSLLARDAFNGTLLWRLPMPQWGWPQWHDASRWDDPRERALMLRLLPATLPRRLVAAGERVYVTLGYHAPVSVLDAATGETLHVFEETAPADEILHADGLLVLRVRTADSPPEADVWGSMPQRPHGRVMVVDAQTGRMHWESPPEAMAPLTLATCGRRVYYSNYREVVCLELDSGRELWRSEPAESRSGHRTTGGTLVAHEKAVLYTPLEQGYRGGGRTHAFSPETGELLWRGPANLGPGISNPPDLFVVDDLVWLGETDYPDHQVEMTAVTRQGFDPESGEIVREVSVPLLKSPGHHYRCYRSKATARFLLLPKRGVEFLDLVGDDHMRHDWLRAPCIYGVLPANGILYVAPHQCVCYPGVLLPNFNALVAQVEEGGGPPVPEDRVQRGPAWGAVAEDAAANEGDWPTYRRDARRSGSAATAVAGPLARRWEAALGESVTPPVVAGGRLLVAEKDTHTVHALDAESGRRLWRFTAGGRVDSPPTVHGELVFFGSADGWVYCLQASDGALVWRFMAAPRQRRIAARGQFESAWPVHGSVLVEVDATASPPRPVVYFAAGRSSFLDGGIALYGLDPQTGEALHHARLSGPRPDPFEDVGMAGYMDGAKNDILVSDGADLYLFQERFRGDLTRVEAPLEDMQNERGGYRLYPPAPERGAEARRLIATSGFLDDSYNEGTFWTYSDRWPGWDRHMSRVPRYGQILAFDAQAVYGVHVFTDSIRVRRGFTPGGKGYRLFAREHEADRDVWSAFVPVRIRAMALAGDRLFFAGPPDVVPEEDPLAAFEGRRGAALWAVATADGEKLEEVSLDALPVFDGLIAAAGRLYLSTTDGRVLCYSAK